MGLLKRMTLVTTTIVLMATGMSMYHANRWQNSKSPQLDKLTQIEHIIELAQDQLDARIKLKDISDSVNAHRYQKLSEQLSNYQKQYTKLIGLNNLREKKANHDYHMNRFGTYNGISLLGLLVLGGCGLAYCSNSNNYSKKEKQEISP